MTVTDQIKIIDNKIKSNQAQYDLDTLAAKISAYSSGDLKKYEYLTGEDLGYKTSVIEQAKFDFSPLGNIFNKGLKEEDKKQGPFKRLENVKDKNEELLNAFSGANKVSKAAKNKSNYNYDSKYTFYEFFRDFKKFTRLSLGSKYDEMNDFHELLYSFINTQKATNTETNDRKNRILSYVKPLYDKYLDAYKKNYDSEKVKDEEKRGRDYKQFEIIDKKKQKSEWTEEKTKTEMQKPLWFKINRKDFGELTGNIYNNQDNNDFKFTMKRRTDDLKNAKKNLDGSNYTQNH